jgi:hypothetical protein
MGSGGGFDRRRTGSTTDVPPQRGTGGVPGKVTRTSRLPRRPSSRLPRPSVQAQPDAAAGRTEENAVMHVQAFGADGVVIAQWRGATFFYGDLPVRYVAAGSPLRWDDDAARTIKIDSDAVGSSGKTLAQWAPRGARKIVVAIATRGAGAADEGAREPAPGDAGDGLADDGSGESAGDGSPSSWDELFDMMVAQPGNAQGMAAGGRDDGGSDAWAGQASEQGAGDGPGTGEGARAGHARGSVTPSWVAGGVPDVDGGRIGDPAHGQRWGRAGGEPGAEGHVDGPGIVGILDVPEEIAPLVNAAAIVTEANLAGLGHKLLRQALAGVAERVLRQQIEREARRMARAGLARVARRMDELDKYRQLPPAERKAILDRAEAAMEAAHRKRIAQHARTQAEDNQRAIAQLDGKSDEQSAHLRRLARENADGYRQVEAAATGNGRVEVPAATGHGPAPVASHLYEVNPKHTAVRRGQISAAPRDGQKALASSVRIKETSTRRVGVDRASGEIVVFDEHVPGRFHGHVRSWDELTPTMQHALEQAGLMNRRGRIIED